MSIKDAKYYISETKEFVSYEDLLNGQWFWKDTYYAIRELMVEEGE